MWATVDLRYFSTFLYHKKKDILMMPLKEFGTHSQYVYVCNLLLKASIFIIVNACMEMLFIEFLMITTLIT